AFQAIEVSCVSYLTSPLLCATSENTEVAQRNIHWIGAVTLPTAADVTTLLPMLRLPLVSLPVETSKLRVAVASIVRADSASLVLSKYGTVTMIVSDACS